jgi:hypothetical protein
MPRRKDKLRPLGLAVTIHRGDDHSPVDCTVIDISDKGARLRVPTTDDIPDHFTLIFAGANKVRRRCTVVWRKPGEIGVQITEKR